MQAWARQKGFTIVELLIVIVIIGILAAISLVAYNGIQQRARSATYVTALHSWENVLRIMYNQNGDWYNTGGYLVCIGSGYDAKDGFAANECLRSVPVAYLSVSTSSAFDTAVANAIGSNSNGVLPVVKTVDPAASNREGYIRGLVYQYNSGSSTLPFIEYYLDKNTGLSGCIAGDTLEYGGYTGGAKRCRRYLQ